MISPCSKYDHWFDFKAKEPSLSKISAYIKNHYTIIFKGQEVDENHLENVKEFLLPERHNDPLCALVHSEFINTFASENDMVFVESVPSFEKISSREHEQTCLLTTISEIFGWDMGTYEEISKIKRPFPKDWPKEGILASKVLDPHPLENRRELHELLVKRVALRKRFYKENQKKLQKAIKETFKKRLAAMKISLFVAENNADKKFLIAGNFHLVNKGKGTVLDISSFYTFLKSRNVVILSPKETKREDVKQYREYLKRIDKRLLNDKDRFINALDLAKALKK